MKLTLSRVGFAIAAASALFIYGCGGSSGGSATATNSSLTGTAATGAALANANVAITNKAGTSPCTEASIITTALGSYTCTLKAGETAPFFIVVTDPTGNTKPLVSIATETPAAGTPLTINATPLTTAIVAQLNGGDALGVVSNKTIFDDTKFKAIKTNVVAQLKAVLDSIGVPAGYDPFTTKMTAATSTQAGDTADKVLDIVKITTDSTGNPAFAVVGNDTAIIKIATQDASTATATVAAPPTGVSELSVAAQLMAQAANSCWAVPTAQRVTLTNGQVTGLADACNYVVTNGNNANGKFPFLHNGYYAGQWFYNLLTSDAMTGAKFSIPEITAFYPKTDNSTTDLSGYDKAVINIRYLDANGNPGNDILVAARIPDTSTAARPTNWWIVGNQQPVDISIKPTIRRIEEFGNSASGHGYVSGFRNGISININNGTNAPNISNFETVNVTGTGLPSNGLWFYKLPGTSAFVLSNYRLTQPQPASTLHSYAGNDQSCFCQTFNFSRTNGLSATASRLDNPGLSGTHKQNWAYASDGAYIGTDSTLRPVKGSAYLFKLYNSSGSLFASFTKRLNSDLVDVTKGAALVWNTAGSSTLAILDPNNATYNAAQASLPIDWNQVLGAEQIKYADVTLESGDDNNTTSVAKGATSVIATAPAGQKYSGLVGTSPIYTVPNSGFREVYMQYRMLDGSNKDQIYSYYK